MPRPFRKLVKQARDQFDANPADAWRFRQYMNDPDKLFGKSAFLVGDADMYRWLAAREALVDIDSGKD